MLPASHSTRLVVPRVFPLTRISVGETTTAWATLGSPTENRWIGAWFTISTEAPLDTDTTCSGSRTMRWADAVAGSQRRPHARASPWKTRAGAVKAVRSASGLTGLPELGVAGLDKVRT